MKSRRLLGGLIAVAVVGGVAGIGMTLRARARTAASTLTRDDAVSVLRLVAGLEVQANGGAKPYRVHSLTDILGMPDAGSLKRDVTVIDSESGSYKGYVLRVWAQDPPFGVSLVPDKPGCELAFFYEGEVIYPAHGLGCDEKKSTPGAALMSAPETLSQDQAVRVMRDASTAEVAMRAQGKEFGNLSDVLSSPAWTDPGYRVRRADLPLQVTDSISAAILNDTLRVTTSTDKKHFQASLVPSRPATCSGALFVDDRSLIYVGKGLGC
jgi:hypothetical protein